MKVETKYELNKYVYFMLNNKINIDLIRGFDITVNGVGQVFIKNWFSEKIQIEENLCFSTKEELIKSL